MVVAKRSSKPVSITTTKALNTGERVTPPNSPKLFGRPKDEGKNPRIKWSIVAHIAPYQPGARSCNLCLKEKLTILQADTSSTLNKRTELNGKCRHMNKFKLRNFSCIFLTYSFRFFSVSPDQTLLPPLCFFMISTV